MLVKVHWQPLGDFDKDEYWKYLRCLYAYTTVNTDEILYIGKAWRNTIHERWKAPDKEKLWRALEEQRQIHEHCIMFGNLELEEGRKFSSELLSDVESLLIAREQPWGNIQSKKSRISRRNLKVKCLGNWIGKCRTYTDE